MATLLGFKLRIGRKGCWLAAVAGLLLLGGATAAGEPQGVDESASIPDELLVGLRPGAAVAAVETVYSHHGAARLEHLSEPSIHRIRVAPSALAALERALRRRSEVEFVEPNHLFGPQMTPNDPSYPNQWHHLKIETPRAWDMTAGFNVVIAIVDSGVDGTHPDLSASLVAGYNTYNSNTDTRDISGHGTGTAGIAAATGNNSTGVAGVSWRSRIMPIRASDQNGIFSAYDIAEAITWAVDHGAKVVSMSIGGNVAKSTAITQASQYAVGKGALVVAAVGNCGCLDSTANNPYIITVSGTTQDDVIASFSSYGNSVDVSAPSYILTTTRGGGYATMGGTSASTPVAAGVVALMMAANPILKPSEIEALLKNTAQDLGPSGYDTRYGWGRVNAYRAVAAAAGSTSTTDATKPTVSIASPSGGATVSGTTTVSMSASDNVGVARVDLHVDGLLYRSDSSSPFSIAWDTATVANGEHTLVAKAYDAAGNEGSSTPVTVTVTNSTTSGGTSGGGTSGTAGTDVASPTTNIDAVSQAGKNLKARVSASDNVGVVRVEMYVDGALTASSTSAPVTFSMKGRQGLLSLQSKAYDAAGNVGSSTILKFTMK